MADAVRSEAWRHTAWIAAMIANANRDPKKKPAPYQPDDFNPMLQKDKRTGSVTVTKENISDVKDAFEIFNRRSK